MQCLALALPTKLCSPSLEWAWTFHSLPACLGLAPYKIHSSVWTESQPNGNIYENQWTKHKSSYNKRLLFSGWSWSEQWWYAFHVSKCSFKPFHYLFWTFSPITSTCFSPLRRNSNAGHAMGEVNDGSSVIASNAPPLAPLPAWSHVIRTTALFCPGGQTNLNCTLMCGSHDSMTRENRAGCGWASCPSWGSVALLSWNAWGPA